MSIVNRPATSVDAFHLVPYCSAVQLGNVVGTQFHPEKSSDAGLRMLSSFLQQHVPLAKPGTCHIHTVRI